MSLAVIGGLLAYFMIGFWLWHSVPARLSPSFHLCCQEKGAFLNTLGPTTLTLVHQNIDMLIHITACTHTPQYSKYINLNLGRGSGLWGVPYPACFPQRNQKVVLSVALSVISTISW